MERETPTQHALQGSYSLAMSGPAMATAVPEKQFLVKIPPGHGAGNVFTVSIAGKKRVLTVPEGKRAGDSIIRLHQGICNDLTHASRDGDTSGQAHLFWSCVAFLHDGSTSSGTAEQKYGPACWSLDASCPRRRIGTNSAQWMQRSSWDTVQCYE